MNRGRHPEPDPAAGYSLVGGPPEVDEYRALRLEAGLSPCSLEQATAAIAGAWAAVHIRHTASGLAVGMGRVIGDGGWYFHVIDMAVRPEHQRRGLGGAILTALIEEVRTRAPAGALVNLLADPPGRRLYRRHGFRNTAPGGIGMAMRLK